MNLKQRLIEKLRGDKNYLITLSAYTFLFLLST